jgi:dihydrofolate synthase/folylpolyglutamate synthase
MQSYRETLNYLYENLPMFQRIGASAFKKDLTNTLKLCEALGNPQHRFKSLHIAGTNGKGSTSHMLASILQSSGYTVGLYTSPHLKEFTERIRVNGEEVSQVFVVDFVNRIRQVIEEVQPSFFEITVAMAFDYFAHRKVDVAVIEVGLGGRLDSTNVIVPELSVITNIGWDHMDLLGDTLEKIAFEKAGIIKKGRPVVISQRQQTVAHVFLSKAKAEGAPIYFAGDEYQVATHSSGATIQFEVYQGEDVLFPDLTIPLQGFYQRLNLPGVLKAADLLRDQGWQITTESLKHGLQNVVTQTGLKGRWQKLQERPLTICDTAHNADGIEEVVSQIKAQHYKKLHIVWGSVKDKDLAKVFPLLPKDARYYFCQANIPRAMDAEALKSAAENYGLSGEAVGNVNHAIRLAKENASEEDLIFIGGSTFVVAEIENL